LDRSRRELPDALRYAESARQGHADRGHPPLDQDGGQVRRLSCRTARNTGRCMTLMSVSEVRQHILNGVEPPASEDVSVYDAAGRILAKDLSAKLTQPPFAASAMDGYAIRAGDIATTPARLRIRGASAAGHGFAGDAGPGEAVRIFTGAPLP